jgi:hypothetical protein
MEDLKIKPYMDEQITYEEQYHDWLKILLANLLMQLLDSVKHGKWDLGTLQSIVLQYKAANSYKIQQKNKEVASNIVRLANQSVDSNNLNVARAAFNQLAIQNLTSQINGGIDSLFNQVLARVLSIVPFGFSGIYTKLFTDETSESDLYRRTNSASMGFAREVYTQGVFNTMINIGSLYGFSEYNADNKHDAKVRPLHAKYFVPTNWIRFDSPPICGHVSTENFCRCRMIAMR